MVQESQSGRQTEREAIAWFTRMNGRPSRADRQNFEDWHKTPVHAAAYQHVSSLWSSADGIGASLGREDKSAIAAHLKRIEEFRRRRSGRKIGTTVLSVLFALGVSGWLWLEKPNFLQDMRADYIAARGEQRSITLSDGSTVLLDADSAVTVEMTDKARRVDLLRGTAYFEVQPSSVPFIVDAANGHSRVLGTAFDISMTQEGANVTLAHGSLQVSLDDASTSVVLKPGESVTYGGKGLGVVGPVDIPDAMAWREGRFVFNNMRLSDVLAQIERNRDGRIVLIGETLAERRVSGSLLLADTDAALDAVQSIAGFQMQKLGRRLVIIR
jgi:transmembrane sensor